MSFAGISIPALVSSALQCAAGSAVFNKRIGCHKLCGRIRDAAPATHVLIIGHPGFVLLESVQMVACAVPVFLTLGMVQNSGQCD